MIFFDKLGSYGRLGNQMFQYAALRGLCLKRGYEAMIPDIVDKTWHGQRCTLGEFNIKARVHNGEKITRRYKEPSWRTVDKTFLDLGDNYIIEGFFQSLYYFHEFQNEIRWELSPKCGHIKKNVVFIDDIRKEYDCEVVSVHLRRGDNMTEARSKPRYGAIYDEGGVYFDYFLKAKSVFKDKKVRFLVFTGGSRNIEDNTADMEWCKERFVGDEFVFSESQSQVDDLTRIMLCDHNIMSHISSFGWWGAYLNSNPNKIVVAPKCYHPEEPSLFRFMFYPEGYILI